MKSVHDFDILYSCYHSSKGHDLCVLNLWWDCVLLRYCKALELFTEFRNTEFNCYKLCYYIDL